MGGGGFYQVVTGVKNGKRRLIGFAQTRPAAEIIMADNTRDHTSIEIKLEDLTLVLEREAQEVAEAKKEG